MTLLTGRIVTLVVYSIGLVHLLIVLIRLRTLRTPAAVLLIPLLYMTICYAWLVHLTLTGAPWEQIIPIIQSGQWSLVVAIMAVLTTLYTGWPGADD